jgi:hypothetical protein
MPVNISPYFTLVRSTPAYSFFIMRTKRAPTTFVIFFNLILFTPIHFFVVPFNLLKMMDGLSLVCIGLMKTTFSKRKLKMVDMTL